MKGESVPLEFELTPEDYVEFYSFHSRRVPFLRRSRWKTLVAFPLIWLGLAGLGGFTAGALITWAVMSTAWVVGVPLYLRWCTIRNWKRLTTDGMALGSVGRHELLIDSRGILDTTPYYESRLFWNAIEEVVDAPGQVLLYSGRNCAVIIPKRAFVSELAAGAFIEGMDDLRQVAGPDAAKVSTRDTGA